MDRNISDIANSGIEEDGYRDPLENLVVHQLRRASLASMSAVSALLAPLGLRWSEAATLLVISWNKGIVSSEIGKHLGIQRSNMVPIITRLRGDALVEQVRRDGRSAGLYLTVSGKATAARVQAILGAHDRMMLDDLAAHDRAAFLSILHRDWGFDSDEKDGGAFLR